ncbi:protein-L-isoaspartate(D-aspartate) O-methyltransferase [Sphingomonas sp. LY54]|uniref:protein-L-isoaspartate(D-aspartate) O-methyltransferase n=1 Tax=Sphingomonas sp. LY54 TaxID=3095343 RepID=UPI002D77FE3C|nr:protein-L-isoaspartate(D-aspartate) O-methyltransferase [Sphingomonas sp. LY54]WRP29402.1 protein-L-isoaspartate(D-aspartate) O-methyltransferase [Sphingomonas sp. LY54]
MSDLVDSPDLAAARERMVERQIAARGITDRRLLEAMRTVPRHLFVPEKVREFAFEDGPLPIEGEQTISQPYIVALMIDAAELGPDDRVLEIGAGSGYAAGIMAQMAGEVLAIERVTELAELAAARMARLDYDNVAVFEGDGSEGMPEEAPFDAIIAAASGPDVPDELLFQLAEGGRLVMPVGEPHAVQQLIKITRLSKDEYEREELGPVRFVPLIGTHGFRDAKGARHGPRSLPQMIRAACEPLPELDDPAFGALFDRYADARIVLLGEASHGTSEFYRARAAITRRLIEQHGFGIVAVEADWPDAAAVDRFVRHRPHRQGEEAPFQRFPTWMWRNTDVEAFIRWLRAHNQGRDEMAGFYGLDLYNLGGSMRAVIDYLDDVDPEAAAVARERYGCLKPWSRNPQSYGRMAITQGFAQCEQPVVQMLRELMQKRMEYAGADADEFLDAAANARLVKNAEAYYRVMYHGAAESWNLRDTHMFETLCQILDSKGPEAKAVVWAHNSHIGDASHTEMGQVREELNIGQLCRERFGRDAALIGFGTHTGTVAAATDWDAAMEVKEVRPSLAGSYERICHKAGVARFLLDLRDASEELRAGLAEPQLERFVGVIYRPETERWSHYAQASLPGQFDAWVWFDESEAVTPLPTEQRKGEDETYPFGL